jgi:hypothetical protein
MVEAEADHRCDVELVADDGPHVFSAHDRLGFDVEAIGHGHVPKEASIGSEDVKRRVLLIA